MEKKIKILSVLFLVGLVLSASFSTLAEESNGEGNTEWVRVETFSKGNLVVGDGSVVAIRAEDIGKLTQNLNLLGSDFKTTKQQINTELKALENNTVKNYEKLQGDIEEIKTNFLDGVNELYEKLKELGYTPSSNNSPAAFIQAINSLRDGSLKKGFSEGVASVDPLKVMQNYVQVESIADYSLNSIHHTTWILQKVKVTVFDSDIKSTVYEQAQDGAQIYTKSGAYNITSHITKDVNIYCNNHCGCPLPGIQHAIFTLLRDGKVRIYTNGVYEEYEGTAGDTYELENGQAFLLL